MIFATDATIRALTTVGKSAKPMRTAMEIGALDFWIYFLIAIVFFIVCLLSCRESFNTLIAERLRREKERVAFLEGVIFGQMSREEQYYETSLRAIRDIDIELGSSGSETTFL